MEWFLSRKGWFEFSCPSGVTGYTPRDSQHSALVLIVHLLLSYARSCSKPFSTASLPPSWQFARLTSWKLLPPPCLDLLSGYLALAAIFKCYCIYFVTCSLSRAEPVSRSFLRAWRSDPEKDHYKFIKWKKCLTLYGISSGVLIATFMWIKMKTANFISEIEIYTV